MNTLLYQNFFRKLCSKCEINPNAILIAKVIKRMPCHLLNQVIDNDIYYKNEEYCRTYYTMSKSRPKLQKQLMLFNQYAHIYPNYSLLPEAKFFYWNINRKQLLINQYEQLENDKEKTAKNKVARVFKKKGNDTITFFDFSVLKELYNTSILNELFYQDDKSNSNSNSINYIKSKREGKENDDVLLLISHIEDIERKQTKVTRLIKPKLECDLSGFWINNQSKNINSQSKTNRHYLVTDSSFSNRYSTIMIHKQKPKITQINIKLNSYNMSYLNKTALQASSNNHTPYYNKTIVKMNDSTNNNYYSIPKPPLIRKAILSKQAISSSSFQSKRQPNNFNMKKNIPSLKGTSKSPRYLTTNNSLLRYPKASINYRTVNTSRIATIPSLTEALKFKVPLSNLKLNAKVLSRIKLKIEKQKGM